ncbi:MAG: efflux RND transporter periplasmic adaptor subunit [Saprospiraceae bacterium]
MKYYLGLYICFLSLQVFAHNGDEGTKQQAAGQTYFSVSNSSDNFELVLHYQPIEATSQTKMRLFLSDFTSNIPVDSATFQITCLQLNDLIFNVKQMDRGLYEVSGTFPENKKYSFAVSIETKDKSDLMTLQGIEVGKKLEQPATTVSAGNSSSIMNIIYIFLAFAIGVLITFLMMRKRIAVKTIALILVLISFSTPFTNYQIAYAHNGEDEGPKSNTGASDEVTIPKETQFLFDVLTSKSVLSHYTTAVKLYGKVMPAANGSASIISPQNGSVVSLNANIGQHVSKGQILAIVEQTLSATEQIQLATEISNANAEYEAAKKDYERLKSISDIIAKKELLEAEIRLQNARENKKIFDAIAGGGSDNKKFIKIKSPIDGALDNFNISIGQQVNQGETLFVIYDVKKLKVEAQIFSTDLHKIGRDASYYVEGPQEGPHQTHAKLLTINNAVSAINQSSQVVLEIDNIDNKYKPGQFVTVDVVVKSDVQQLVVPTSAISDINGKSVVFIHHEPEVFKVIYIQAGQSNAQETVILKGLEENERVVSNSTYEVKSIFMNQ